MFNPVMDNKTTANTHLIHHVPSDQAEHFSELQKHCKGMLERTMHFHLTVFSTNVNINTTVLAYSGFCVTLTCVECVINVNINDLLGRIVVSVSFIMSVF